MLRSFISLTDYWAGFGTDLSFGMTYLYGGNNYFRASGRRRDQLVGNGKGPKTAAGIMFDYLQYLLWSIRLSFIVLPIIPSSFHIQPICFLDVLRCMLVIPHGGETACECCGEKRNFEIHVGDSVHVADIVFS
jgi:hypothetical protein